MPNTSKIVFQLQYLGEYIAGLLNIFLLKLHSMIKKKKQKINIIVKLFNNFFDHQLF